MKAEDVTYTRSQQLLLRRALSPANTSAALLARAKAIEQLSDQGVPVPITRIRAALEEIIDSPIMTFQSEMAMSKSLKLLALIDGEVEESDAPPPRWRLPGLTDDERIQTLEVDLLICMTKAAGLPLDWAEGSSQLDFLLAGAEEILAGPDIESILSAAERWMESPPDVPAGLRRSRVRVLADEGEEALPDDAELADGK